MGAGSVTSAAGSADGLRRGDPGHPLARCRPAARGDRSRRLAAELRASSTRARPSSRWDTSGEIAHPLDGMGAVVPAIEHSPILACSFSSQKYPHRRRRGKCCCGFSWAGPGGRNWPNARRGTRRGWSCWTSWRNCWEFAAGRSIATWPIGRGPCRSITWATGTGRADRGPRRRLARLQLAGNAYHGVGIPDCIHGGELRPSGCWRAFPKAGHSV